MSYHISPSNIKEKIAETTLQKELLDNFFKLRRVDLGQYKTFYEKTIYEQDLLQEITWTTPEGEKLTQPGYKIFNRKALFQFIREKIIDTATNRIIDNQAKFVFVDIKNFRATNIPDNNGILGGDYILKEVVTRLMKITKNFKDKNNSEDQEQVRFGRYGGDEFLFFFSGSITDDAIKEFFEAIIHELNSIQAYFNFRGKIIKQNIQLKNNLNIISVPEKIENEKIFIHYLYRNILLDRREIDLTKQNITDTSYKHFHRLSKQEILTRLHDHSDQLSQLVTIAETIDTIEHKPQYINKFITYYNHMVEDPLFERVVLQYNEFIEQLSSQPLSHILVFDLKFIKELNDNYGIAMGDKFIQQVLLQIMDKFDPSDREEILVGRRGGTFIIGIKSLKNFQLKSILFIHQFVKKPYIEVTVAASKKVNIPIGFAKLRLSPNNRRLYQDAFKNKNYEKSLEHTKKLCAYTMSIAELKWYQELGKIIQLKPKIFSQIIQRISYLQNNSVSPSPEQINKISLEILTTLFFSGSRLISSSQPIAERYLNRLENLMKISINPLSKGQKTILNRTYNILYNEPSSNISAVNIKTKPSSPSL